MLTEILKLSYFCDVKLCKLFRKAYKCCLNRDDDGFSVIKDRVASEFCPIQFVTYKNKQRMSTSRSCTLHFLTVKMYSDKNAQKMMRMKFEIFLKLFVMSRLEKTIFNNTMRNL